MSLLSPLRGKTTAASTSGSFAPKPQSTPEVALAAQPPLRPYTRLGGPATDALLASAPNGSVVTVWRGESWRKVDQQWQWLLGDGSASGATTSEPEISHQASTAPSFLHLPAGWLSDGESVIEQQDEKVTANEAREMFDGVELELVSTHVHSTVPIADRLAGQPLSEFRVWLEGDRVCIYAADDYRIRSLPLTKYALLRRGEQIVFRRKPERGRDGFEYAFGVKQ